MHHSNKFNPSIIVFFFLDIEPSKSILIHISQIFFSILIGKVLQIFNTISHLLLALTLSLAFWSMLGSKFRDRSGIGHKGHKENWLCNAAPSGDIKLNQDRNSLIREVHRCCFSWQGWLQDSGDPGYPEFTKPYHTPVLVLRVPPFLSKWPNFNISDLAVNSKDTLIWQPTFGFWPFQTWITKGKIFF